MSDPAVVPPAVTDLTLLALASLVLVCAHALRAARWSLLFPDGSLVPRFSYLLGLSAGYLVNTFVPLRLGELLRIAVVSQRSGHRLALVGATVVVERITDLVAVAAIFAAIALLGGAGAPGWGGPAALIGLAAAGVALALAIPRVMRVRRLLWSLAGLFNTRISLGLADLFWVFSELIASRVVLRLPYLAMSAVMWAAYILSYNLFAAAIGLGSVNATVAILSDPMGSQIDSFGGGGLEGRGLWLAMNYVIYTAGPLAVIQAIGLLLDRRGARRLLEVIRHAGRTGEIGPAGRDRFMTPDVYNRFLSDLFRGADPLATRFWREALGDCVMHRFFNGGSDAITALVEVDERLAIRKFAIGPAGEKLRAQADWLRAHEGGPLPLVRVAGARQSGDVQCYDMPFVVPANDFFDVIHTRDHAHSAALLRQVIDGIEAFHAAHPGPPAEDRVIEAYLDAKARANAQTILAFVRTEIRGESLEINGRRFDLARFETLTDRGWLRAQIRSRRTAVIHGDLTIENIIIAPQEDAGLYVIDPNPDNIFNTPLIDWAKLMQSLHLGYETLNRGLDCTLDGAGAIRVHATRSHAYSRLHDTLVEEFTTRHGPETLRELYFHEIVNYLRLTTYKIRQDRLRGLGFFACTMMILDEYLERWDTN
ncbi:lysylphosphatidylglycerol synthase domain-containing protein [Phaeovulum vinaykumarii]|uniref:Phosphotransferase enzyme family protein n=1 Tax=Phaeovulum vinaykumarii TaxID=407234 RepID=A0A1N7JUH5_9RHOB|nr:lysylphosphatidylglycerol synthase domain-containing protein [Phaeovulum vinaykumarii]SIS52886.1 Phosphotransferase enzyme family protein [Phaeovulum vinaykumarii]SOB91413.1 phosphotransferase family enzyme [Phaeovulum vinaykumarii]